MTAPQEDWIYLDEPLPEIHIREIVSIDELLERNSMFVALSEDEIYQLLRLMFRESPESADAFFAFHKELTHPPDMLRKLAQHIIYDVNAKKKDFGTEESEEEYFQALRTIEKIQNYRTREQKLTELHEPLERTERLEGAYPMMEQRMRALVRTVEGAEVMRLENDKEAYEILSGELRRANHVPSMYMGEHVGTPSGLTLSQVSVAKKDAPMEEAGPEEALLAFSRSLLPSTRMVISQMRENPVSDLRSLEVLFQRYGLELEQLQEADMPGLLQALLRGPGGPEEPEEPEPEGRAKAGKKGPPREIKPKEISYVKLHRLFWDSIRARLTLASDTPLYADIVNQTMAAIREKPMYTDVYVPLSKQMEKLDQGTMKLEEFLQYLQLMRNRTEREMLLNFQAALHRLEKEGELSRLEPMIKDVADRISQTVDPEEAEEVFGSKAFLKEYKDPYALQAEPVLEEEVAYEMVEERDAFVLTLPEEEEDVDLSILEEEEENELMAALKPYETSDPVKTKVFQGMSEILKELHRLTRMPWEPARFIKILMQRSPPVIDISMAMFDAGSTLPEDLRERIAKESLEEVVKILPMEQQEKATVAYREAQKRLQKQRQSMFFLFLSYWILHIQSLMLEKRFVLQQINPTPCREEELIGPGFPVVEGREGKKGVLSYFACILHEEGRGIPRMEEMVDNYSREELVSKLKEGFACFAHEIELLQKMAHSDVVYRGSLRVKDAIDAFDEIKSLGDRRKTDPTLNLRVQLLRPYIKTIQLLPSIPDIPGNMKERHKHILGCCYVRLDDNYLVANRMSNRLQASKEYFAKYRVGQEKRPLLLGYAPPALAPPAVKEALPDEHLAAIGQAVPEEEGDWRETVRDKALPFLPNTLQNILRKENSLVMTQLDAEALRHLNALSVTLSRRGEQDNTLWQNIQTLAISELYGLFAQVSFGLYKYAENASLPGAEQEIIRDQIGKAQIFVKMLRELKVPDQDSKELQALLQLVVCRTVCLPGEVKPNQTIISITQTVSSTFVRKLAEHMAKALRRYVDMRIMPTIQDIQKKISEIREKRKLETILKYEQNPELNKLIKQARLQGINLPTENLQEQPMLDMYQVQAEDMQADFQEALAFQPIGEDTEDINPDRFYDY